MAGTSMRDIKRRIRSVKSIENITNAMKLVSSAKLRRARLLYERTHESLVRIEERIEEIFDHPAEVPSQFLLGGREIKRTCYIVITSNRGLAGSYNANVIKLAEREFDKSAKEGHEEPLFVFIGNRGMSYFKKRGHEVFEEYHGPLEVVSFAEASALASPLVELYESGEIDEIAVVSTVFVSAMEQRPKVIRLLPFNVEIASESESGDEENVESVGLVKKVSEDWDPEAPIDTWKVEYEPDVEKVLGFLVSKYVDIMMFRAIIEAATCEHAARRIAMQNATDNAREMIESLELSFNRARQAAITREITEIVSGADAVKR